MLPLWTSVEYIEARIDVVDSGQRSSDQSALLGVRGQSLRVSAPGMRTKFRKFPTQINWYLARASATFMQRLSVKSFPFALAPNKGNYDYASLATLRRVDGGENNFVPNPLTCRKRLISVTCAS